MKHSANNLVFGGTSSKQRLALPAKDRNKHLYVCGRSGAGKTKFLESLIRQDILTWRKHECGLVVIDPHGSLYDDLIDWMVFNGIDRPIVPIDLRRSDLVVGLNVLRKRGDMPPSVIVDSVLDAAAHAWGAAGTDGTPRLAHWMRVVFLTLYNLGLTIAEATELISPESHIRETLAEIVTDRYARKAWNDAIARKSSEFLELTESLTNRLGRFISNEYFNAIFGQTNASFDFGEAMEKGSIVLVNASTEGANISPENARLFPSLLIDELWTAAKKRGKSSRGDRKPFRVYVDEFQEFVTPTLAKNLDQARGFGLEMVMAHQFPTQLLNEGLHGKAVYDSVLQNAGTKVVFETQHPEDLDMLAGMLFRQVMNPNEIKHELYSTKVMAYREVTRVDDTFGATSTSGESNSMGGAMGRTNQYDQDGNLNSYADADSSSHGRTNVSSFSESHMQTRRTSLEPVMGKELSSVQFRSLEEQRFKAMQALSSQDQRYGVAKMLGQNVPVSFKTPNVVSCPVKQEHRDEFLERAIAKLPFAIKAQDALRHVEERVIEVREMLRVGLSEEPTEGRRRL